MIKKEEDLARIFIAWLESKGWDIYPEVQCPTGRIDIYGKQNGLHYVIETKMHLNLEVLQQAFLRRRYGNYVAIGVPHKRRNPFVEQICRDYGIGLFSVSVYGGIDTEVHVLVKAKLMRGVKPLQTHQDMKKYTAGASGTYWTPFKDTCEKLKNQIKREPGGLVLKDVIKRIKHHYSNDGSAHSCLVSLIQKNVIPELKIWKNGKQWVVYHVENPPRIESSRPVLQRRTR